MSEAEVDTRYHYADTIFRFRCTCGAEVETESPNSGTEQCECGKKWRIVITAVSIEEGD